jgi:hypothetical protein
MQNLANLLSMMCTKMVLTTLMLSGAVIPLRNASLQHWRDSLAVQQCCQQLIGGGMQHNRKESVCEPWRSAAPHAASST